VFPHFVIYIILVRFFLFSPDNSFSPLGDITSGGFLYVLRIRGLYLLKNVTNLELKNVTNLEYLLTQKTGGITMKTKMFRELFVIAVVLLVSLGWAGSTLAQSGTPDAKIEHLHTKVNLIRFPSTVCVWVPQRALPPPTWWVMYTI